MKLDLPVFPNKRVAAKVSAPAERKIKQGHPWIFESAIQKIAPEVNTGDLVILFDRRRNKFLALGLYDASSPIRIKIIQQGKSATINQEWFNQKLAQAYAIRKPLLATKTTGYRLLFGENDNLPSLIVDVFEKVVVIKIYSGMWLPYLENIREAIIQTIPVEGIVLRMSRNLQKEVDLLKGLEDGQLIYGDLAKEEVLFSEHGLSFIAHPRKGHKTGFFLDHRANRKRVGAISKDKTVLDIFSYAGGFSVHALAGGATEVCSLDINAHALEMAKKNANLNHVEGVHEVLKMDAFKAMDRLKVQGKRYDIIIIDPPSFAKQASEVPVAISSYKSLVFAALPLLKRKSILIMASCSSRVSSEEFFNTVENVLNSSRKKYSIIDKTYHDIDHPIGFPEGAYLKCGYYRFD